MTQTLGRYTLLGKIATGGMAEVFLGRLDGTSGFERKVVIKKVLPQYATQPEFLRLFQQEARFASFLSHPHIATVSDFGVDPAGAAYLVMEYVEGASLRALIRAASRLKEKPDARLVSRVFSQVAEALAAVHAAVEPSTGHALDLVHRDVSPENVLLSRQGAVKLADFGIARAMNEVSTTSPEVMRGKLRYMAPEQITGAPLSPAIDVWALGVSLYESLVLARPFPEDNEAQTVNAIANVEFQPLIKVRPELPPDLCALVDRCLSREPAGRPQSQDLALQLERVASGGSSSITARVIGNWVERLAPAMELSPLPISMAPPSLATPAPVLPHAKPPEPKPPEPLPPVPVAPPLELARPPAAEPSPETSDVREAPRPRWPIVAAVLLFVLGLGGFGLNLWLNRRPDNVGMRQVMVTSTPTGATVKYGSKVLGTTPWAGDLPALHDVELEVSAPGYHPARKTLPAGDVQPIDVSLKKRP